MDNEQIISALDNLISGFSILSYNTATTALSFEYINDGAYRMLGTTRAAGEKYIMNNVREMILPQDAQIARRWISDIVDDNGDVETVFRYVTFQGSLAYLRVKGNLIERHGTENRIVCTFSDCTEEMTMQLEMEKQLNFINSVVETRSQFDYQVKTDTCVVRGDKTAGQEEGVLIPDYLSASKHEAVHPEDRPLFIESIERMMKRPHKDQIEYRARELDGSGDYRWTQCSLMSIAGNEGYVTHVLGLTVDIHDRKMEELKLQTRADTDSLTLLLNKGATETLIRSEIESHHDEKHMDALMVIDVDDFKFINDNFGHAVGDRVLHFVGETLKQNVKGMDVAGRIGGDEFMIFLQNIKSAKDTEVIASHLQDLIRGDFDDEEVAKHLSVSIGISIGEDDTEDYEALFKEADSALYNSKRHGKATYTVFRPDETAS